MKRLPRFLVAGTALGAGLLLAACGGGGNSGGSSSTPPSSTPPASAPTVSLSANPTSVSTGGTSTLTWSSTNATACTASGAWSGAQSTGGSVVTGALSATSTFTLTCSGAGGTTPAAASATVTVTAGTTPPPPPAAPTALLTASPPGVAPGGSATLTWSSTNATACTASSSPSGGPWTGTEPTSGSVSTGALNATTNYSLTCTGAGGSANATATVSITNTSAFATTPRVATLTLSQTQQFTAAVTGGGAATWSVDGIVNGNATVGTISSNGLYTPPATPGTHTVLATSVADATKSGLAVAAVTDLAGNFTFHNDLARTGQNLQEYALTTATVSGATFGKRWACPVDGDIYGQPLYVANFSIGGGKHNVLFVVTQNDSIYAIDADSSSCATYWQKSVLSAGATPISYTDLGGCNDTTQSGITGTPVIDPASQTLYFVAQTKESGSFFQRLHALNLATGAEVTGSPVTIPATIPGGTASFDALQQNQRAGLVLYGGGVFVAWSSHCDTPPYWGLLMRFNASTLARTAVFNVAPGGTRGAIWMSASAPAVDAGGNMFLSTGNGSFNGTTAPGTTNTTNYSMSFLNFNPATLLVQDFYTPSMEAQWSADDEDISSGGVAVLPDGMGPSGHPNLLVGADKQSHIWLIDRSSMSGFNATGDNTVQFLTLPGAAQCSENCMFSSPAYYNGTVYVAPAANPVMALPLTGGVFGVTAQNIAQPSTLSADTFGWPGATPAISASPNGNAIVWVLDNSAFANQGNTGTSPAGPALLRAYDAGNLTHRLFDSSVLAANTGGGAVKFTVPVIANGHVYIGGGGQLTVYGLSP